MAEFSEISKFRLSTCHPDLVTLFEEVIKYFDCTVAVGYRNQADQEAAFAAGNSKLHYPYGNHNQKPSMAADVYSDPIDFNDIIRSVYFAGIVMGLAKKLKEEGKMSHDVRWGGDWRQDNNPEDNKFNDMGHFELVKAPL